jgi:N-hydroxyarylamine O-acetyltransferase
MTSPMLGSYLDRIGWGARTDPTRDTLAGLLRAHMQAIPFENLDVLLGREVRLDLDSLVDKLIRARRGGYCFEHTTLFAAVLEELGFRVGRHSARVTLVAPRHEAGRLHMLLTVSLPDGRFVADPGFGGPAACEPLPLEDSAADGPDGASHWMTRDGAFWVLKTQFGERAGNAWASTLEEDHAIDFAIANHYTSTHPASPFRNRLMLSLFTPEGRVSVMNRDAAIRRGAETKRFQLADRAHLRMFIREHLGFDAPEVEGLHMPFIPEWR